MKKLHLKSTEEFENLFKNKTLKITNHIVEGISEAMEQNIKVADLFEVSFEGEEMVYEISLPQNQWATALQSCLDIYHKEGLSDECIDTWKLLETAKLW
ncbi:hypothetical protein N9J42_00280 [bacterium]|nr:hypothetical protein [bacterium]